MKPCAELGWDLRREPVVTLRAVIASPDRSLAGVEAAAIRFWTRSSGDGAVRSSGWIGGPLSLASGARRIEVPLRALWLEPMGDRWEGPSPVWARGTEVCRTLLRHGDVVTLHAVARGARLVPLRLEHHGGSDVTQLELEEIAPAALREG